jgi:hypothetical protein
LVGGFLKVGLKGSFGGDVAVTTQKFALVTNTFLFAANCTDFSHVVITINNQELYIFSRELIVWQEWLCRGGV